MMKLKLIAAIFLACSIQISAQSIEPSETYAVIVMLIVDEKDKPLVEEVELVSKKTQKTFKGISDKKGMVRLKIPNNDTYVLNLSKVKSYDVFEIPEEPYYSLNYKVEYKASRYLALGTSLIKLQVVRALGEPLPNETVIFTSLKTQKQYVEETNEAGKLSLELPYDANYSVGFASAPDYDRFQLPKKENYTLDYELKYNGSGKDKHYPSMEKGLLLFSYTDLEGNPVPNEQISIISDKGKKSYSVTTNREGKAHLLVPLGDKYTFSAKHFKNFQTHIFPDKRELLRAVIQLTALSSEDFELRKKERGKWLRMRDSIFQTNRKKDEDILAYRLRQLETNAKETKKRLKKSPKYFEEFGQTINAVLYRYRDKWKHKIIITDVTCSMDPYLYEVFLWHTLKLNPNHKNEYLFFNDGDEKSDSQKKMGETGGFHYTNSAVLDSLVAKAWYAKRLSCGGDGPENDFEAILKGIEYKDARQEIILIADNYSDVRDYSLLEKINAPVRIILCGADYRINEQYLNLAYRTKGSIHSIKKDLNLLKRVSYGSEITYLDKTYVYTKGGFIYLK